MTRLADDVEDMQIAYGIDRERRRRGDAPDGLRDAIAADDPDLNVSTVDDCDEWFPNAAGETTPPDDAQFQAAGPVESGARRVRANHCPRLHAVMISLLAKAHDSDPTYKGPAAAGLQAHELHGGVRSRRARYRRRVQTLKINLRNYAFQG